VPFASFILKTKGHTRARYTHREKKRVIRRQTLLIALYAREFSIRYDIIISADDIKRVFELSIILYNTNVNTGIVARQTIIIRTNVRTYVVICV